MRRRASSTQGPPTCRRCTTRHRGRAASTPRRWSAGGRPSRRMRCYARESAWVDRSKGSGSSRWESGSRGPRPAACSPTGAPTWSRSSRPASAIRRAPSRACSAAICRAIRSSRSTTAASAASCSICATDAGRGVALELLDRADVFVTNVRLAGLARLGLDPKRLLRAQPAPRLRRDHRLRLRRPRRRPRRLRHRRLLGALGHRGGADAAGPPPARSSAAAWATTTPASRSRAASPRRSSGASGAARASSSRPRCCARASTRSPSIYRVALRFGVGIAVADRKTMGNPCINNYQDADGRWFWIVGLEGERHWPPLARVVGHPEWIDDPRFATAGAARRERARR